MEIKKYDNEITRQKFLKYFETVPRSITNVAAEIGVSFRAFHNFLKGDSQADRLRLIKYNIFLDKQDK